MVKGKGGKDRPKSSAHKRKKAGSPDGSDTPMDGQLTALDNYHQPPIVDVIRGPEINNLLITESDMISMRPQRTATPPKTLRSIDVRKKRVLSNAPTKTVAVLKKVEAELPDVAVQSAGPRFNTAGEILSYSILGPVEQFKQATLATGQEEFIDQPVFQEVKAPQPIYVEHTVATSEKDTREGHALKNWERQLQEHSKQMRLLAERTGKHASSLLMNSNDEYRTKQEERIIIDRAIPVMDRGKGYRVGSEFWSQPQYIGDEDSAIVMTLNRSEQGKHPEIERIGQPFWIEGRQGQIYPWKRNKFFEQRRKELIGVLSEQEPHKPDFSGLFVRGTRELQSEEETQTESTAPVESQESIPAAPLESTASERKGPILEINGVESRWACNKAPTVTRILFTTETGFTTQLIALKNTGTTAIFYAWKFLPKENKLNTIMEGNKQRFYFSINDGVILPGEEFSIPLIFLSKQAGIYTESWQFITKPVLNDGAPIVVTLKGVALKRDVYKAEKEKIEELLEKRQTQYNIKLLVDELIRGVHSPPPPAPPAPRGPTLPERFNTNNPYLHYQSDYYKEAEEMWAGVCEEGRVWDETLLSLREAILKLPLEEQTEKMEEFNSLREKFTQPRLKPFSEESYDLCYGCLRAAVDAFEQEDLVLRGTLALPERVHIEEPPPIEHDATSEKTVCSESRQNTKDALISPAPDSKKSKKEADRKKETKTPKDKPRTVSKNSKKSDQQLIPDEEEIVEKKEWQEITDPVLKKKYREKLNILAYNILSTSIDHITLALEEQLGKSF